MSLKEKYNLEYILKTSLNVAYRRISTASGFMEWFADNVLRDGDIFTFIWDGSEEKAELVEYKHLEYTKFKWLENDDDTFLEFKLQVDELTNDLVLIISDFAYPDEIEDAKEMWDSQVDELKHNLGI